MESPGLDSRSSACSAARTASRRTRASRSRATACSTARPRSAGRSGSERCFGLPTRRHSLSLLSLTLSQYSVVGGTALSATVELSWAASREVRPSRPSDSGVAPVPASVTVPAGATRATFPVTTGRTKRGRRDDHRDVQRLTGDDDVGGHPLVGTRPAAARRLACSAATVLRFRSSASESVRSWLARSRSFSRPAASFIAIRWSIEATRMSRPSIRSTEERRFSSTYAGAPVGSPKTSRSPRVVANVVQARIEGVRVQPEGDPERPAVSLRASRSASARRSTFARSRA